MPVAERSSAATHPEQFCKRDSIFKRIWDSLVHPVIRLPIDIPWDLKQFSRLYVVAAVYYTAGSVIPLLVICGVAILTLKLWPTLMLPLLLADDGGPNGQVMLFAMLVSFVGGFGAEMFYFNKQLRQAGLSIVKILHLNLDSLNGSWLDAVRRSSYTLAIGLIGQFAIERLPQVPTPHQATADMAAGLHGGGLLAFAVLAAVMAPFFEEIIFRGFLFNSFRKIFREGRIFKLIGSKERAADYCAVTLSAFMFAAAHMDATAFFQLFLLGILMAELYRRSGTLICPMLLHAMNNVVATLLVIGR